MGIIYTKRFDTGNVCDVTEDFTLPDYQAEIRRVVGVSSRASVDGKYLSGDVLEVDGGVTYTVLYVGSDGLLHEAAQTSSYTGKIQAPASDRDRFSVSDLVLSGTAENASCRVVGPRRITLSSRVRLSMISEKPTDTGMSAEGEVRCKCVSVPYAVLSEIAHTSEAMGEIREREGAALTLANGEICVSDARVVGDRVAVKGDVFISLVLRLPEGEYVNVRKSAPLEEYVPIPNSVISEGDVRAVVYATPLMLEVESTEDGTVTWKMEYDLTVDLLKCGSTEIVRDAYLTESEDEVKTLECDAYYPASAVNGRMTSSASVKQKAGMRPVFTWGVATCDKCDVSSGKMTLSGSVKLNVIMECDGEFSSEEVTFPMKYECDAHSLTCDTDEGAMQKRVAITVCDAFARSDGDTLSVTAELGISVLVLGMQRIGYVQEITPVGEASRSEDGCVIRVYAPDEGESSWDVEKRFRLKSPAKMEGGVYVI